MVYVPFTPKLTQNWFYASALIDTCSELCPPPPATPQCSYSRDEAMCVWNSYRDFGQRVLAVLSLSVVASLHSLNTKCDCNWLVLEIKSADVVLHKLGISATSWIPLFYTCARGVQTQPPIACTRL